MAVVNERKKAVIETHRVHAKDSGSAPVQVAVLTDRIQHLTRHLQTFPKDNATRRGLLKMVGRRAALLRWYAHKQPEAYQGLIEKLGIRR
jgi:small subunit ribosomal protein S15